MGQTGEFAASLLIVRQAARRGNATGDQCVCLSSSSAAAVAVVPLPINQLQASDILLHNSHKVPFLRSVCRRTENDTINSLAL